MKISALSLLPASPCILSPPTQTPTTFRCSFAAVPPPLLRRDTSDRRRFTAGERNLGRKWTEYQGVHNWDGLLDPLDDDLRTEIIRFGRFVEAAYSSFESDPLSPVFGACRHPKSSLLSRTGLDGSGYRLTKYLRATSGIELPHWVEKASTSAAARSSWIGYVAVCEDKKEIARLGRRDVVIAYRGTATCLEWLENLRATLTAIPETGSDPDPTGSDPMVESGFLSLYSSGTGESPSLKETIREEVSRLLQTYAGETLSLTITGHSLGAALATLTAYDVGLTFREPPFVTVVSFGGPRVGNRGFRRRLEKHGTKVLRIVNSDDVVTKVPGFVIDDDVRRPENRYAGARGGFPSWIQRRLENTRSQWMYSEVGKELRLNGEESPFRNGINIAMSHDLRTYLHLLQGP